MPCLSPDRLRAYLPVLIALSAFSLMASRAPAQTSTWTAANGIDWNSASNWSGGVPTTTSNVIFNAGAPFSPNLTANGTAATLSFNSGSTNYNLTSNPGISLSGVSAITIAAGTTGVTTINTANIPVDGSLFFPSGQNLTFTNNASATSILSPKLIIGPNTVIGTPGLGGLVFEGTGTTSFSGSIATNPNLNILGGLTKNGTGTLNVSGNGTTLVGGVRLNAGTLRLDYSANATLKFSNSSLLTSAGGDLEIVPSAAVQIVQSSTGLSLTGRHTQITFAAGGQLARLDVPTITRSVGATVDFSGPSGLYSVSSTTGNTNGLLGTGPAFATFDRSYWATSISNVVLAPLAGTVNTFSSGTNTDLTSNQSVGNVTTNSLRFDSSNVGVTVNFLSILTVQSGGILVPTGVTGSSINGGRLTTPGGTGEFLVHAYGPLSINTALVGTSGLTKTGSGELTFNNNALSSLSGDIKIYQGDLRMIASSTYTVPNRLQASTSRLFKSGGGTFVLTSSNNSVSDLFVEGGALVLTNSNNTVNQLFVETGNLNLTDNASLTSIESNIGNSAGSNGGVNVGGGTGAATWNLANATLRVGHFGNGTLNIIGGGTVNSGTSYIGFLSGSMSTASVGGGTGTSVWNVGGFEFTVGESGQGTLNILGGGTVNSGVAVIGRFAGSSGSVNVGGGTGEAVWNVPGIKVGEFGNGTLTITGGGTVNSGGTIIGRIAGSSGSVNVGGGTGNAVMNLGNGVLDVGVSGNGTLTITGGGTVNSGNGNIGFTSSGGRVDVGGGTGAAMWNLGNSELRIGLTGPGNLTISGGGTVSSGKSIIGFETEAVGIVNVGGGTGISLLNTGANDLEVGRSGIGILFLNTGGTVAAAALNGGNSNSSVNFNGGTLRITATDTAFNTFNVLLVGGTLDLPTTNTTFTYTGTLAGTGILTKTGRGTLVANGTGTAFTGSLNVADGLLEVPNDSALSTATLGAGPFGVIRYTATAATGRRFQLTGGVLQTAVGTTLTLQNGAEVAGGFLNSNFTGVFQSGPGGATVRNATIYTGTTLNVQTGPLTVSNLNFGGAMTVAAGQTLTGEYVAMTSSGQLTVNGTANLTGLTSNGRITINNGGSLVQQNANATSPLTLGGGSVTTVNSGGTLNWGGSGATQLGRLAGGVLINSGNVTGGRLVVDYGGLARGTGSYSVNPLTMNGGQFSPGSSPGRVNVEAFIADAGGSYLFEINDGTPGLQGPTGTSNLRGWDLTTVRDNANPANSAFFVESTPANRFTINLRTLTAPSPPDVNGNMDNFNPNAPAQWLAFSVDPAATNPFPNGFDSNAFAINTSGFANANNGSFALIRVGNDLFISYTPVPEPVLMIALGAGCLALFRVTRRTHPLST